jgi:hypothetical protein
MPLVADIPKLWLPPPPAIIRPARELWRPPVRLRFDQAFMPGITPVIAGGGAAKSISFIDTAILTTNLTTYSFTGLDFGAAQDDRYIIGVAVSGTASRSISSATIGGVTARVVVSATGGSARNAGIIIANVPTGTSGAIAVTWNIGCSRRQRRPRACYRLRHKSERRPPGQRPRWKSLLHLCEHQARDRR